MAPGFENICSRFITHDHSLKVLKEFCWQVQKFADKRNRNPQEGVGTKAG